MNTAEVDIVVLKGIAYLIKLPDGPAGWCVTGVCALCLDSHRPSPHGRHRHPSRPSLVAYAVVIENG